MILQFQQLFLFWAIGLIVGSCIAVFGKNRISQSVTHLKGSKIGILGIIPSSVLGIASPICMFGTIPVAAALSQEKVPESWLAAFMMSSILLNPQLLIFSFALGTKVVIFRLFFCILGGILAGLIIFVFFRDQHFFSFTGFEEDYCRDIDPNMIMRLLKNIHRAVMITAPYFLLGIFLAALYQVYCPPNLIPDIFSNNSGFGILLAASLGVPLYVCGGGTIPILKAWLDAGMSLGSAIAFMITGPATKITNISAVKIILGRRSFCYYLLFVMIFSVMSGFLIDVIRVKA